MSALPIREYVVAALRATRLLGAYDTARFLYVSLKARGQNSQFLREHPGTKVPPLSLCYDAFGHVSYAAYFGSGAKHAEFFAGLIDATGLRDAAVLEWGCGPARVLRHLGPLLNGTPSLAGSDYNPKTIAWCRASFPGIRFERNELAPPLSFPAASFDVIYALSVITHLSEKMHEEWRNELLRVLKPGGLLIVTSHGEWYRERYLLPPERARFDAGSLVVRGGIKEGKKWFAAFHPSAYMRGNFLREMESVQHLVRPQPGILEQDVWIARKRRHSQGPAFELG